MSRKIRSVTETSKPRRTRWTLRALTAGVLAAGSLAALAGPAQAYDGNICAHQLGGAANVFDVDPVRIDTKHVDFGDLPHSFPGGGGPQADAVICWGRGGTIIVVGRGFYDSPAPGQGSGIVELLVEGAGDMEFHIDGSPGAVTGTDIRWAVTSPRGQQVRIRLLIGVGDYFQTGVCDAHLLVHTSAFRRGD